MVGMTTFLVPPSKTAKDGAAGELQIPRLRQIIRGANDLAALGMTADGRSSMSLSHAVLVWSWRWLRLIGACGGWIAGTRP